MTRTPTRIAIAVVEHEGFFLIGQRPAGAALAGLWEFPGGKVDEGETVRAAAVRECLEETGVMVEICGEYSVCEHQYEHDRVQLQFFDCRPLDPQQTPRDPYRWVPRCELSCCEFPAANQELLQHLTRPESQGRFPK